MIEFIMFIVVAYGLFVYSESICNSSSTIEEKLNDLENQVNSLKSLCQCQCHQDKDLISTEQKNQVTLLSYNIK